MSESSTEKTTRIRAFVSELIGDRKMSKKDAVAHLVQHGHDALLVNAIADEVASACSRYTRLKGIFVVFGGIVLALVGLVATFASGSLSDNAQPTILFYGALAGGVMCCIYGIFMIVLGKEADDFSPEADGDRFLDSL